MSSNRFVIIEAEYRPDRGYAARYVVIDLSNGFEIGRLFREEHAELLRDGLAAAAQRDSEGGE